MVLSDEKIREYMKRLLMSRMRILMNNGFYGLLLMHMTYAIDESIGTAATNGSRIIFDPVFLDEISDSELDFVMMHEILHVALQHCVRMGERDLETYNIACDIVVNSNILLSNNMKKSSITISRFGETMHLAPNGTEGYEYTAEQVYEMLKKLPPPDISNSSFRDDHSKWPSGESDESDRLSDQWKKWFVDACEAVSIANSSKTFGGLPLFARRLLKELKQGQINWREILHNFIQEEITDYSFTPPDKRFADSPFFLPDFNEKDENPGLVWFVVDTSGSISDDALTAAYSEIRSALEQFNGKLNGILSFTESYVTDPIPFSDVNELMSIKPVGGGGNDFSDIFRYMQNNMTDNLPSQIIIITDGYDLFPPEKEAMGIPVLWLINNDDERVNPPFGKVARITV